MVIHSQSNLQRKRQSKSKAHRARHHSGYPAYLPHTAFNVNNCGPWFIGAEAQRWEAWLHARMHEPPARVTERCILCKEAGLVFERTVVLNVGASRPLDASHSEGRAGSAYHWLLSSTIALLPPLAVSDMAAWQHANDATANKTAVTTL